ncbi:hypothetical protein BGZ99_008361 [Dissophora globulifera]|uniref:CMP/dCMP-type deaminase domain-containing protein n=1 Tax=Dissophora globulifera TaxID=979702 RepID=A0A9P6R9W0_9FUNG|nr:hypothetical protein BGZ99_008361 [Dissophora globulifera]
MKVLSKDDNDAAMHIYFLKLAIEQAHLSPKAPSNYCVGAVLVQETHSDPDSELPQEDKFKVVTTGFSNELPGNTHAEECCLLKLDTLLAQQTENLEELVGPVVVPAPGTETSLLVTSPTTATVVSPTATTSTTTAGSSRANIGQRSGSVCSITATFPGSALKDHRRKEWIMYSTMEPCSTRLSGKKSCSERLIASGIRRVYIGVREPDRFVQNVVGVENMADSGIEVVHIPGLEEECLAPNKHVL